MHFIHCHEVCALSLFLSISYLPIDFSFPRSDSCYSFHIYLIIDALTFFFWLRNILFKMQGKPRMQIFDIPSAWIVLICMINNEEVIFWVTNFPSFRAWFLLIDSCKQ